MIYYSDDNSMVVFTNKLKVNNADKKKDKKNYKRCPYKKLEQKKSTLYEMYITFHTIIIRIIVTIIVYNYTRLCLVSIYCG